MTIPHVDITNATFKANPFPYYAQLRDEAPVHPVMLRMTKQRAWLVTRYVDVLSVLKDDRFAKDRHNAMTPAQLRKVPLLMSAFKPLQRGLLSLDGTDHDRLRALVHQAFTARMIEQMRDQIQTVADELLDAAAARGSMDVIADYALPLPLTMIGRILGIPAADNAKFHRWTTVVLGAASNRNPLVLVPNVMGLMGYLKRIIRARQAQPQDDLISALAAAKEGNDHLSNDEILSMIFLLLSAGHETTVNLIGSGTLALLEHSDQLARLRDDPAIIKPAIEELLRFVCPAETATERYARMDLTVAGTTIPRGELVLAVVGSANRDPAYFADPDTLDLTRANNKHLSFGQGIHYCLGAPLSRLEGQIAIGTLVNRFPNLRLSIPPEQVQWKDSFILRGLKALPVSL